MTAVKKNNNESKFDNQYRTKVQEFLIKQKTFIPARKATVEDQEVYFPPISTIDNILSKMKLKLKVEEEDMKVKYTRKQLSFKIRPGKLNRSFQKPLLIIPEKRIPNDPPIIIPVTAEQSTSPPQQIKKSPRNIVFQTTINKQYYEFEKEYNNIQPQMPLPINSEFST